MSHKYASDQPAGVINHIQKVAIVGAGGNIGKYFAEELIKTGKHTVTALTRADSKSTVPEGVKIAQINYDDEDSLVSALKGQQFLVITMGVRAPADTQIKIVKAAAKAGVPYIMPNIFGYDITNEKLAKEYLYSSASKICDDIKSLGVSSYVAMCCGFWYEWSLALGPAHFGFDFKDKKVTFFDDGKTVVNVSTWRNCGHALAGLLSLKETPEDANDKSPTVSQWKDKPLYVSSFRVSQRDMLDSVHRVKGTTDGDWEIVSEPSIERYKKGIEDMKKGDRTGFARAMYTRVFFQNGDGDFESSKGLHNSLIGLPNDSLDEATKRALAMVESGWNPFA
ncbi:Quinone oxidoreductase [Lachnellula subtilissima]|uniref:Quinone oxidoreductase n=1 Tax=Lachnellula subtilissima TaxID=602034 RepID=A0A8H8UEI7_9HELO|nr:Quinone oxidoreductase [Lachnellula subtilissima]